MRYGTLEKRYLSVEAGVDEAKREAEELKSDLNLRADSEGGFVFSSLGEALRERGALEIWRRLECLERPHFRSPKITTWKVGMGQ